MAGLTIFNPLHLHFLPLTSSSSSDSYSSSTTALELDSSPLWDCELLQPPSLSVVPRVPSTLLTIPTPDSSGEQTSTCNAHRRLMEILNLTSEPHANSTSLVAQLPPFDAQIDPAIPASHCHTPPPPPYAMHSPLTHKTPFSSYRLRGRPTPTGKSTLSFRLAAPVPRIPLASVLQHWASHDTQQTQTCGDDMSCVMEADQWECEEFPESGLGLLLGAAQGSQDPQGRPLQVTVSNPKAPQHPYSYLHPRQPGYSHPRSQSQSRSRYSRRLRRIAPAPLQLTTPTPRTPLRTLTFTQGTPTPKRIPASAIFVDVPLDNPAKSDIDVDASDSPQSHRQASVPSAMASKSTAPTSLLFPSGTENASQWQMNVNTDTQANRYAYASTQASPPYVDLLSWRRTVTRALDSPLSPLRAPKSARTTVHSVAASAVQTPHSAAPLPKSSAVDLGQLTPGLPRDTAPPPLRRTEWVPLPQLTDEAPTSPREDGGEGVAAAYCADLRLDLDVEDLALRAEKCAETIVRASLSLRSCSLLKAPEAIAELCESLRHVFESVQCALDGTPTDFVVDGSEAKDDWYAKHWDLIDSLNKNLNYFYLLAHQIEDRPPRIHRLAPIIDKLTTYQAKFTDLVRKIPLSHEKLRLLNLRGQLTTAHSTARGYAYEVGDRRGRRNDRIARQQGRARQREIREEIRRVRATMRTMHASYADMNVRDENMMICDEDEDMDGGKGKGR